jgi:hypothetical protein
VEKLNEKTKVELEMHKRRLSKVQQEKTHLEDQIAQQSFQFQSAVTETEIQSHKEIVQLLTLVSTLTFWSSK